jgi:hypothetical protein
MLRESSSRWIDRYFATELPRGADWSARRHAPCSQYGARGESEARNANACRVNDS